MNLNGFKAFLSERNLDENQTNVALNLISEFGKFLAAQNKLIENVAYDNLYTFSEKLVAKKKNSFENYLTLLRFGHYQKNHEIIIASLEILDGREMIENFSKRLTSEFSNRLRNEVFAGIDIPPLGIRPHAKVDIIKKLTTRFLAMVDYETGKAFFEVGLRNKYPQSYEKPIELYQQVNDIDEFLKKHHQNLITTLENHQQENTLFFTQEIDEEVISYVRKDQTIEAGIRDGNLIRITKIPYLTKQFLHEADKRKRRYYYCHNPWIREALKDEDQPINPLFCGCSAGYFRNFWEAVLNQPVIVEVIRSVIKGDEICEFALHLPQQHIPETR